MSDTIEIDNNHDILQCYSEVMRKARKKHRCCECCRDIQPGEVYTACVGLCDHGWCTNKVCTDCWSVVVAYFHNGIVFESMWEYLNEHIRECVPYTAFRLHPGLTRVAKEKILYLVQEAMLDE